MPTSMPALAADLAAETASLERVLQSLTPEAWLAPTPAAGWTVQDQIAHLAYFDEAALSALLEPERFRVSAAALIARGGDFANSLVVEQRSMSRGDVYAWFRSARTLLIGEASSAEAGRRVPWYGPEMSVASCITARLMETWAHGQDVADAVGIVLAPTGRLKHIAHLGYRALPFSFGVRDLAVPTDPIRVELVAPDGSLWSWGPEGVVDRVRGTALDFCLVVTQRRHREDMALEVSGPAATAWMSVAQAYAGPPGPGRAAGSVLSRKGNRAAAPA